MTESTIITYLRCDNPECNATYSVCRLGSLPLPHAYMRKRARLIEWIVQGGKDFCRDCKLAQDEAKKRLKNTTLSPALLETNALVEAFRGPA